MAVDSLHFDLDPVDINAVALPDLNGAEAEGLRESVKIFSAPFQGDSDRVKMGRFGAPGQGIFHLSAEGDQGVGGFHRCRQGGDRLLVLIQNDRFGLASPLDPLEDEVRFKGAVGPGVNGCSLHMFRGAGFQPDRPEDPPEYPVVSIPLRPVDRSIGRHLADGNFQQVDIPEFQHAGDVIAETVEGPLVDLPGRVAVDLHFGIGHRPLKDDLYLFPLPGGRNPEGMAVEPFLVGEAEFPAVGTVVAAVVVLPESLLFPVGGYFDGGPVAAVAPRGAVKLPGARVVTPGSREILDLFSIRCGHNRKTQEHCQRQRR